MLETLKKNETFEYQKLSPEEMKAKGVLGYLVGPCADFINPTRNGRGYNEELWDKVFDDPIVNEKIENKALFGELGHPADRDEVEMEKIAIALNEKPKKDNSGKLQACFSILDTPNGRILKTLCDYGTTIGISSRGTGDVTEDEMGNPIVDPDTYQFECFDAVIVPAVKEARLKYVNESLENNALNLNRALRESLNKENEDAQKVVKETLNDLGINLEDETDSTPLHEDVNKLESNTPKQTVVEDNEAKNNGSVELIERLSDTLAEKADLEAEVKSLKEQLALSNTKATKLEEDLNRYKSVTVRLTSNASKVKTLETTVSTLEESLKVKDQTIEAQSKEIAGLTERLNTEVETNSKSLTESISTKDAQIAKLTEALASQKTESDKKIVEITEALAKEKTDSTKTISELNESLTKARKLAESRKQFAIDAVNHYITMKAKYLGCTTNEITSRLPEKYTLSDVDRVCDSLTEHLSRMNKLPFQVGRKATITVTESTKDPLRTNPQYDDSVDDMLLGLAGLK